MCNLEDISVFLHIWKFGTCGFLYKIMKNKKTFDIELWTL